MRAIPCGKEHEVGFERNVGRSNVSLTRSGRGEGWSEASLTALPPREGSARLSGHPSLGWPLEESDVLEEACRGIRAAARSSTGSSCGQQGLGVNWAVGLVSLTLGDLVNPAFAARALLWHILTAP